GDIIAVGGLTDVIKMTLYRAGDVDLSKTNAQSLAQNLGVGTGAFAGAEAGHGQSVNGGGGAVEYPTGPHGYQKSQTGVETARNADHSTVGMGVFHALGKTFGL